MIAWLSVIRLILHFCNRYVCCHCYYYILLLHSLLLFIYSLLLVFQPWECLHLKLYLFRRSYTLYQIVSFFIFGVTPSLLFYFIPPLLLLLLLLNHGTALFQILSILRRVASIIPFIRFVLFTILFLPPLCFYFRILLFYYFIPSYFPFRIRLVLAPSIAVWTSLLLSLINGFSHYFDALVIEL